MTNLLQTLFNMREAGGRFTVGGSMKKRKRRSAPFYLSITVSTFEPAGDTLDNFVRVREPARP
jgi:hypothetical protein